MSQGTEKPTQAHLRKLRDSGYVPRSATFTRAMGFFLAALSVPSLLERILLAQREYLLELFPEIPAHPRMELGGLSQRLLYSTFVPIVLFLLVVVTGQVLVGLAQTGGYFRPFARTQRALSPSVAPRSLGTRLAGPVGSLTSILVIFALSFAVLFYDGNAILSTFGNFDRLTSTTLLLSRRLLTVFAVSTLVFSLFHFGYSIYAYRKQSKMTHAQLKQEQREQYGSNEVSSERKRVLAELESAPLERVLPFSNLAIEDGSSLLVLLAYDPKLDAAPRVLKSVRHFDRERSLPLLHRATVPVVVDEWLSDRLSRLALNAPIPVDLFAALADAYLALARSPTTPNPT